MGRSKKVDEEIIEELKTSNKKSKAKNETITNETKNETTTKETKNKTTTKETKEDKKEDCFPSEAIPWYRHGDSNPGFRRERATS